MSAAQRVPHTTMQLATAVLCRLQSVPHLPLPLVKMCDFGYSKEENKSAAKSKVSHPHSSSQRADAALVVPGGIMFHWRQRAGVLTAWYAAVAQGASHRRYQTSLFA